jgi:cytochrome c biogenesis protein CcmG/thiol:disulfide interchange protein DsbE
VTEVVAPPVKRSRPALWIAVALAVVLGLLIAVLATRDNAATRLVRSPLVGHPVPALTGTTVDGSRTYAIDDHQGEWVLVNFFATWCVPCQQEHDDLARFAKFHEADGDASVVSVVFDDTPARVKQYFAQRGGTWPVVRDDGALATAFGVARVPESYLVAPNGVVVAKITGGVTYDFLQEQLAKFGSAQG